jgi:branched-chain amino acid transport system substrate-binding protein
MKRNLWFGIGIVVVVALAIVLIVTQTKKEPKEIKIGAILPLTGDAAIYGQEIKNGIDLATNEVNTVRTQKIRVIYEDDQGNATTGISAIQKLISQDKVPLVIGGAMSSVCAAIGPVAMKNKIILLSPTATAPLLTNLGSYFFRIWPSDNYDGEIMAKLAYEQLGIQKVSILYVNLEYGKGIEQVFRSVFEKLGGEVLNSEGYIQGTTDFRTQLLKIKSLAPDAVYLPGYYREIAVILRQAKELGIKPRWLSVNSFYDPKLLEIAGGSAEGAIFTYPTYDSKSEDPITHTFVDAFKKKYGKEPDAFAVQGYDALKLIALVTDKDGLNAADSIRNALLEIKNYPGVGGQITFDRNGDVVKPLRLMTVTQGKFTAFKGGKNNVVCP